MEKESTLPFDKEALIQFELLNGDSSNPSAEKLFGDLQKYYLMRHSALGRLFKPMSRLVSEWTNDSKLPVEIRTRVYTEKSERLETIYPLWRGKKFTDISLNFGSIGTVFGRESLEGNFAHLYWRKDGEEAGRMNHLDLEYIEGYSDSISADDSFTDNNELILVRTMAGALNLLSRELRLCQRSIEEPTSKNPHRIFTFFKVASGVLV